MVHKLHLGEADFQAKLGALMAARALGVDVSQPVSAIIEAVKTKGDAALFDYTRQWDQYEPASLRLSQQEMIKAAEGCDAKTKAALKRAASRIESYSQKQLPEDVRYTDDVGATLGWRWRAVARAGLYVPGGLAAYPSSVLMNAIPAKVAGVRQLVVTVPAPKGVLNPTVMAACLIAGVDEVYTIGGAQAIAALAYGSESIRKVDVIVGPGNAYVAEAKRQVFGRVGIDMVAGPSEVLVVADASVSPAWVAMDLLSQAEHDENAQSICITDNADYAEEIVQAVQHALKILPRADIARAAWERFGAIIIVDDLLAEAPQLIDQIAPEHLQLACNNAEVLAERVQHAGAIFIGSLTPEAIGDYIAGPSHVLPTSGTARFASGLSVYDFLKRTSIIQCDRNAFAALADDAVTLAESEALHAHLQSVAIRKPD